MSAQLPADIGGYQHLAPDVICQEGDIYVQDGKPEMFVAGYIGSTVEKTERGTGYNVYRRIPCPKQGGEAIPTDAIARKDHPIITGVLDYFPDALMAVAYCSKVGNDQHNPGKPMHWDRSKSKDEADALGRHLIQRGTLDTDGVRHSAKVAWRALAMLQKEIEAEGRS
jgi:hypothetical protein